jgi:hypothetical protein
MMARTIREIAIKLSQAVQPSYDGNIQGPAFQLCPLYVHGQFGPKAGCIVARRRDLHGACRIVL